MMRSSWRHGITRYQWLVLFVAWLGWVFEALVATIYAFVLNRALHDLLAGSAGAGSVSDQDIGWYGGLIFSIFLVGWAIGGIFFGMVADYLGRTKTLIATILIYAVFTGLAALSQEWWHLAVYRFLTALGIGGEWAAGAAIVAETWPEQKRAKAAGILQSAWAAGFFLAALANSLQNDVVSPNGRFGSFVEARDMMTPSTGPTETVCVEPRYVARSSVLPLSPMLCASSPLMRTYRLLFTGTTLT